MRALRGEARLEGLAALAQRHGREGDGDQEIELLKDLLDEASTLGNLPYELRAFGELRRIHATDPRYADLRKDVLWYFKWIAQPLVGYADVSLEQIESVLREMEAFYRAEGESLRPAMKIRCVNAWYTGRPEEAEEWFARWEAEPPSESDDCPACEVDFRVERQIERRDDEGAIREAGPLIEVKVEWCRATAGIASALIPPAMRAGRESLANWLHAWTAKQARREPSMLDALGHHAIYDALTGDEQNGRRLALVGLRRALGEKSHRKKCEFYRAAAHWAAITAMNPRRAGETVPGRLLKAEDERVDMPRATARCLELARENGAALDARNGTSRYADRVTRTEEGIRKMTEQREAP